MKRYKKRNKILLLLVLFLGLGIGFSAIATTLKINGTATIAKNTWSVYWDNPVVTTGSVTNAPPTIGVGANNEPNTAVSFSVNFTEPGQFYEFTIDAVNNGSIDAMITGITKKVNNVDLDEDPTALPAYVKYEVTYADGTQIQKNYLLAKKTNDTPTREKYKVRVEFRSDVDSSSIEGQTITLNFKYEVPHSQATDSAVPRPVPTFLEVGKYFTLVPDKETATTNTPGFSGSTPTAEQSLWRVININEDGTVDAVANYVSTQNITIGGINGFKYYVAGMQDLASCYAKEGYTVATRMMGYDGQTLVIEDTSAFDGTYNPIDNPDVSPPSTTDEPWVYTGTGEEFAGGVLGDTLYLKDWQLVQDVYGNTGALRKVGNVATTTVYWLASRAYGYNETEFVFHGHICNCGMLSRHHLRYYRNGWLDYSPSYAIRPIITIRGDLTKASGAGTQNNPYIFN